MCLVQAASAAALSLLAARDPVVSDTLRYLGALPLLVELLNSPHLNVTEAARYADSHGVHTFVDGQLDTVCPVQSRYAAKQKDRSAASGVRALNLCLCLCCLQVLSAVPEAQQPPQRNRDPDLPALQPGPLQGEGRSHFCSCLHDLC